MNITKLAIFKKIKTKGGGGATVLEGDGQNYHQFAPTALTFRSTEPLEEFMEVQVNDETVDPENYTLEEGSTIVTLKPEYLKTLGGGKHEIAIVSQNKTTSGKFDVTVPELNEYGFYYNQPYTAYVDMFGENEFFFIRDDGTLDVVGTPSGDVSQCTYTCSGNSMTVISPVIGTLTATISDDGTEIFCNELQIAFTLGNESVIADEDYIYIYKEDLCGYEVKAIDKTKAEYGAIKTGINGIPTVKLADSMFYSDGVAGNLTHIVIPNGVTSIGVDTFNSCSSLVSIVIPDSVISIGDGAFAGCSSLTSVAIPDSVTSIDSFAFADCFSLTSIVIPDSVISIGNGVFQSCSSLESVVIGGSVTSISERMFSGCSSLTDITFEGTTAQWNAITKVESWNQNVPATYVQCSDGQVSLV